MLSSILAINLSSWHTIMPLMCCSPAFYLTEVPAQKCTIVHVTDVNVTILAFLRLMQSKRESVWTSVMRQKVFTNYSVRWYNKTTFIHRALPVSKHSPAQQLLLEDGEWTNSAIRTMVKNLCASCTTCFTWAVPKVFSTWQKILYETLLAGVVLSLIYLKGMIMQPGGLFLTEFTDLVLKNFTVNLRVVQGGTVWQVTKIPLHLKARVCTRQYPCRVSG